MALDEETILVNHDDDPVIYGNHSCDPNLWLVDAVTLAARRDIGIGEEITTDYATLSNEGEWREDCNCRSRLCRSFLSGLDWRRPELWERYRGHFSPFLEARISAKEARA